MSIHIHEHTYIQECMPTRLRLIGLSPMIALASLSCTCSCYLLCCVLARMCLAAAGWQYKNGLLVTVPLSQPVAGLRLYHFQLLPAVAQPCNLMVEMRLAAASWQSKNCSLRYFRSEVPILIKICCGGSAVLEMSVSFQNLFYTRS